ncbi:MAG: lipid II flippase Amj family protein [Sphingomonadaceae bacterium]|jgi:hypothetical protein
MDTNLAAVLCLAFIINAIGALAYAARIAGVRTGRIAMSFALFNVLLLVSRLSNGFLAPLVAKRVENGLAAQATVHLETDFRLILLAAFLGVLFGLVLVPTAQRLFARAIAAVQPRQSLAKTLLRGISPGGLRILRTSISIPARASIGKAKPHELTWSMLTANCVAQALLVVGVFASLYAGHLDPDYRVTASQLSAVVNGFATILLFLFIDPHLSVLTDDVVDGNLSEPNFRRVIAWISLSRLVGTLLAQVLFLPAAIAIAWLANLI